MSMWRMSLRINSRIKFSDLAGICDILHTKCLPYVYRRCSTGIAKKQKLEDYFFDQKVQSILKKITGLDYNKVFQKKQGPITSHKYEFVTEKQLKEMYDDANKRALAKLQMPPVMSVREPIEEILTRDPELQSFLDSKLVFIDTSKTRTARDRIITVRETDGTLRKANWDERFRMNQIFFPIQGRSLETPKLFESPYLDKLLDEESYMYVLDAACAQFEPDDPEYHRVTNATYEHINTKKKFDILRSTRHFGPMAFYFAVTNNVYALLVDMIEKQLISDAADTIKLLYILNPELKVSESGKDVDDIVCVQEYVQNNKSVKTAILELAVQTYLESQSNLEAEKENASL